VTGTDVPKNDIGASPVILDIKDGSTVICDAATTPNTSVTGETIAAAIASSTSPGGGYGVSSAEASVVTGESIAAVTSESIAAALSSNAAFGGSATTTTNDGVVPTPNYYTAAGQSGRWNPMNASSYIEAVSGGQKPHYNTSVPTQPIQVLNHAPPTPTLLRCPIHSKPDINCRDCRKSKAGRHIAWQQQTTAVAPQNLQNMPALMDGQPVPMKHGPGYNMNVVLRDSILMSEYYRSLASITSIENLWEEIEQYANSLEPTLSVTSRTPSTLFCCLYKMFGLQPTDVQIERMLTSDNGMLRCCGFLFLRYVLPPEMLWEWVEPYLLDDLAFKPGENTPEVVISNWLEHLLMEEKYYSTPLPRIPIKIKLLFGAQMVPISEHRKRRAENRQIVDRFREGVEVCACHDGLWQEAEIVSSEPIEDVPGQVGCYIRIYKEEDLETDEGGASPDEEEDVYVDLGYIIIKDKWSAREVLRRAKEVIRKEQSLSRDAPVTDFEALCKLEAMNRVDDLTKEYKRIEQEKAISKGKDYARRPTSYKAALSTRDTAGEMAGKSGGSRPPRRLEDSGAKRSSDAIRWAEKEPKRTKTIDPAVLAERQALIARYTSQQKQNVKKKDNTLEERFMMG